MKLSSVYSKITVWSGLLVCLAPTLFLLACEPPVKENRLEQMAKGCCECTTQLMKLNQQAAQSTEQVDFKALEAEYQRTKDCLGTVTNHFGKLKADELKALETQLQSKCPQLASQHELLRELLGE